MSTPVSSRDQAEADLVAMFLVLPRVGKAHALATLIHWETIRAREAYLQPDAPIDGQILRQSNEHVHRLAGYSMSVLRGNTTPEREASSIHMIIIHMVTKASAERGLEELDRLRALLREVWSACGTLPLKHDPRP